MPLVAPLGGGAADSVHPVRTAPPHCSSPPSNRSSSSCLPFGGDSLERAFGRAGSLAHVKQLSKLSYIMQMLIAATGVAAASPPHNVEQDGPSSIITSLSSLMCWITRHTTTFRRVPTLVVCRFRMGHELMSSKESLEHGFLGIYTNYVYVMCISCAHCALHSLHFRRPDDDKDAALSSSYDS